MQGPGHHAKCAGNRSTHSISLYPHELSPAILILVTSGLENSGLCGTIFFFLIAPSCSSKTQWSVLHHQLPIHCSNHSTASLNGRKGPSQLPKEHRIGCGYCANGFAFPVCIFILVFCIGLLIWVFVDNCIFSLHCHSENQYAYFFQFCYLFTFIISLSLSPHSSPPMRKRESVTRHILYHKQIYGWK